MAYQSIYSSLPEDDEFITLSPLAKALWYTLKVKLPATGLGAINPRVVATLVNCSLEQLAAAESELAPKWVRRDGNLWWIIAGLRFQPSLSCNDRKHRAMVRKQIEKMPSSPLVDEFRALYEEWFSDSACEGHARPIEAPSEGHGSKVASSSYLVESAPSNQASVRPPSAGPVQMLVLERLAPLPRAQRAVEAFFARVPNSDDPEFWAMEVNGWLDGLNTMRGREATAEHVAGALEEFNRKVEPKYDPPYIRGFLRRTMMGPDTRQRSPPTEERKGIAARGFETAWKSIEDL